MIWTVIVVGFPVLVVGGLTALMAWESRRAVRWLRNLS